jgi:hypothetical protein
LPRDPFMILGSSAGMVSFTSVTAIFPQYRNAAQATLAAALL